MKLNALKEEHYFNEIAAKNAKMRIEVVFEARKVLLVCVFLISRTRLCLNITTIINFEIKHTEFFYSCIFPLPYIVISEIGISFSITGLVRTKFALNRFSFFLVYHFHENIDYLKNHTY